MIDKYNTLKNYIEDNRLKLCETWVEAKGLLKEKETVNVAECFFKNGKPKKTKLENREEHIDFALDIYFNLVKLIEYKKYLYESRDIYTKYVGYLLIKELFDNGGIVNGIDFINEILTYKYRPKDLQLYFINQCKYTLSKYDINYTKDIDDMFNDVILNLYRLEGSKGGKAIGRGEFLINIIVKNAVKASVGDISINGINIECKAGSYRIIPNSIYGDGYQGINPRLEKEFPDYFQGKKVDLINSYDDYCDLPNNIKNRCFEMICNTFLSENYDFIKQSIENNKELWFSDYDTKTFKGKDEFDRFLHILPNLIYGKEQKFDIFFDMNIIDGRLYAMCLEHDEYLDINIQDKKHKKFIKKISKHLKGRERIGQVDLIIKEGSLKE